MYPTSNSVANATENVETNYIVYHILELVMKISHACEVCGVTYEGGAGVGTIVCPKCLVESFDRQSEEDELNEIERVFGSHTDCSDPSMDDSLLGP